MEQRQAVRIPVQLRARLLHEEGRHARPAPAVAYQVTSSRRPTTDHEIVCSCSTAVHHHGGHAQVAKLDGGSMPLAIDGTVDDLSRNGLFLRTPQTLPPKSSCTRWL